MQQYYYLQDVHHPLKRKKQKKDLESQREIFDLQHSRMSIAIWIAELFESDASSIQSAQRNFVLRYRSPEHWLNLFKTTYGPMLKAFAVVAPSEQSALENDILALIRQFNRVGDGSMVVPSEYLEIVVERE